MLNVCLCDVICLLVIFVGVAMEFNLKFALLITAVVFAIILGFGITAITSA